MRGDALGNLVDFVLLPGQRHDLTGVPSLLDGVAFEALIAERAYDSNALRAELKERGATAVIPPKSNRVDEIDYDVKMYKWRHLEALPSSCDAFCEDGRQLRRDDSCDEFSLGACLNVNRP